MISPLIFYPLYIYMYFVLFSLLCNFVFIELTHFTGICAIAGSLHYVDTYRRR